MSPASRDVAQVRLDNAMRLFEEFVSATVKHPDAATLRGLERRFAERLQIQPSYWSQIKGRSRQIGERLARQFEQLCHKAPGWMDLDPLEAGAGPSHGRLEPMSMPGNPGMDRHPLGGPTEYARAGGSDSASLPKDDDERFIIGLVLTYYRRHPQRARTRLLDLLGEVLTPTATAAPAPVARPAAPSPQAELDEWRRLQAGIAPLKPKKR